MQQLVNLAAKKGYDRFHPQWFENNQLSPETWLLEMTLLQKWLREKHCLIVTIDLDQTSYPKYCYDIVKYHEFAVFERKTNLRDWGLFASYEKAFQEGLKEALTYI